MGSDIISGRMERNTWVNILITTSTALEYVDSTIKLSIMVIGIRVEAMALVGSKERAIKQDIGFSKMESKLINSMRQKLLK